MLRWGKPRWNGVPCGYFLRCLNAMGYLHDTVSAAGGNDNSTQQKKEKKISTVLERSNVRGGGEEHHDGL
jgi:hypothetical protein